MKKTMISVIAASIIATFASATEVHLHWSDPYDNELGYYVERAPAEGEFEQVGRTEENATDYIDENVEEGVTYRYRIQAFNYVENSYYSREVEVIVADKKYFEPFDPSVTNLNLSAEIKTQQ